MSGDRDGYWSAKRRLMKRLEYQDRDLTLRTVMLHLLNRFSYMEIDGRPAGTLMTSYRELVRELSKTHVEIGRTKLQSTLAALEEFECVTVEPRTNGGQQRGIVIALHNAFREGLPGEVGRIAQPANPRADPPATKPTAKKARGRPRRRTTRKRSQNGPMPPSDVPSEATDRATPPVTGAATERAISVKERDIKNGLSTSTPPSGVPRDAFAADPRDREEVGDISLLVVAPSTVSSAWVTPKEVALGFFAKPPDAVRRALTQRGFAYLDLSRRWVAPPTWPAMELALQLVGEPLSIEPEAVLSAEQLALVEEVACEGPDTAERASGASWLNAAFEDERSLVEQVTDFAARLALRRVEGAEWEQQVMELAHELVASQREAEQRRAAEAARVARERAAFEREEAASRVEPPAPAREPEPEPRPVPPPTAVDSAPWLEVRERFCERAAWPDFDADGERFLELQCIEATEGAVTLYHENDYTAASARHYYAPDLSRLFEALGHGQVEVTVVGPDLYAKSLGG